jgi:hypothetical protein
MCASTLPLSRGNLWARRDGYDAKKSDKALIKSAHKLYAGKTHNADYKLTAFRANP